MRGLVVIALLIWSNLIVAQHSLLWDKLQPGQFAVGFKEILTYDQSRRFDSLASRPMQVAIWYPAEAEPEQEKMPIAAYFDLDWREVVFDGQVDDSLYSYTIDRLARHGAEASKIKDLLGAPSLVTEGANAEKGTFPLITFVQGGGRPARSAFLLGEYLASYGYVVATMPHIGKDSQRIDRGTQRITEQVRDLNFLLSETKKQPFVDQRKLVIMGFSTGAEAIFLHSSIHKAAEGIVTFDGMPDLDVLASLPDFNQSAVKTPMLFISSNHGGGMTALEAKEDTRVVDYFPEANKYVLRMMELNHPGLLSIGMMEAKVPKLTRFEPIGDTGANHAMMLELVRTFVDAVITGDPIPISSSQKAVMLNFPSH